jgi:hypothetical protein
MLALALVLFVLPSISFCTALQMVHHLKTSHVGAAHQYAPREQYNDFHDGDTDEEIEMEPASVVVPDLVMVSDDEEDPEEMITEEDELAD